MDLLESEMPTVHHCYMKLLYFPARMWCHEWFELAEAPDIVTFSKKMLTGGLYHKADLRPQQAWRVKHSSFIK